MPYSEIPFDEDDVAHAGYATSGDFEQFDLPIIIIHNLHLKEEIVLRLAETFGSGGRYCGMSQIRLTRAHSFRRLESDFYLAVSTPASAPRQVKVSFI